MDFLVVVRWDYWGYTFRSIPLFGNEAEISRTLELEYRAKVYCQLQALLRGEIDITHFSNVLNQYANELKNNKDPSCALFCQDLKNLSQLLGSAFCKHIQEHRLQEGSTSYMLDALPRTSNPAEANISNLFSSRRTAVSDPSQHVVHQRIFLAGPSDEKGSTKHTERPEMK